VKLPNVDRVQIPQAKTVEYLLSPTHPEGAGEFTLDDKRILHAKLPGQGTIWVQETSSGILSNEIHVEAVACTGAEILGVDRLLLKGERVKLKIVFHTTSGQREDLLIEGTLDETDAGKLSRAGAFTSGLLEGPATVRVRYGEGIGETASKILHIGPDAVIKRGRGGEDGGDIPLILTCGTPAPGMEDYPPDQRTHQGGEHHPTIIEEPPFEHVVWINQDSKESMRVRKGRGGPKGSASIRSKVFTQFVALKCFEILKRLKVRNEVKDTPITELQFRDYLGWAEIECAGFIDEAYELADRLFEEEGEKSH
jgi:hypothetical protein